MRLVEAETVSRRETTSACARSIWRVASASWSLATTSSAETATLASRSSWLDDVEELSRMAILSRAARTSAFFSSTVFSSRASSTMCCSSTVA